MPSKFNHFKRVQQRLCRDLNSGRRRVSLKSLPLSRMLVSYFDRHCTFDYLEMDFLANMASSNGGIDPCTLLVAMIYVERLRKSNDEYFQQNQPSDLYLAALILAGKYLNDSGLDEFVWNDEWASHSGQTLTRINQLELEMLNRLEWKVFVRDGEFDAALTSMEQWLAADNLESNRFSYNDIGIMLGSGVDYLNSMRLLLCGIAACTACYLSAIMTAGLLATTLCTWTHILPRNSTDVPPVAMANNSRITGLESIYPSSLRRRLATNLPDESSSELLAAPQSSGANELELLDGTTQDVSESNFSTKAELYLQLAISKLITSNSAQHCKKVAQAMEISEYSPIETPC